MDAIEMLEKEHAGARKAMEAVAAAPVELRMKLFGELKRELEMHDRIEEEIFYPAAQSFAKTADLPAQDSAAHRQVEDALAILAGFDAKAPQWSIDFSAMQQKLLLHIADEEGRFFPRIREAMSASELGLLGGRMAMERQRQLAAVPLTRVAQAQEHS